MLRKARAYKRITWARESNRVYVNMPFKANSSEQIIEVLLQFLSLI